jgi:hypothetical protein
MTLTLATAASGVARSAHYIVPTGGTVPIQTLLLEPQRTNLVLRSEEFNTTWTATNVTVTANNIAAPDGTTTADLLNATTNGGTVVQAITFTTSAEKCAAIYLKAGTAAATDIQLWDDTAPTASRHLVRATWAAGVPTLSTVSGAGTLYPVEAVRDGWYRILFSATDVVAANANQVRIFPASASTGTVYAWGAQAEDAIVPSSYIKTEATTVTRSADSLYFPFTAPPQALTVYVRGVAREFPTANNRPVVMVGDSASAIANNQLHLQGRNDGRFRTTYNVDGTSVLAQIAANTAPAVGDLAEFRVGITSDGRAMIGQSVNNGAELTAMGATALGFPTDWNQPRIALATSSATPTMFAFTHVLVAAGEQSLATMRQLAGVV